MSVATPAPDAIDDAVATLPPLASANEVATLLRCSRRELYRRVSSGEIRAGRHRESGPSTLLIPRRAVADYLRRIMGGAR